MSESRRIDVTHAHDAIASDDATLVCAYEDEDKCRSMRLAGALTFGEFRDRADDLSSDREIIFYCA